MPMSATTHAGDWWESRKRGERMAAHELPPLCCDLCSEPMQADRAVFDATNLNICPLCLEESL